MVLALDPGPVYEGLAVSGQSREGASDVTVNLHNLQAKRDIDNGLDKHGKPEAVLRVRDVSPESECFRPDHGFRVDKIPDPDPQLRI
jgi:hypothetical protein